MYVGSTLPCYVQTRIHRMIKETSMSRFIHTMALVPIECEPYPHSILVMSKPTAIKKRVNAPAVPQ